MIIAAAMKIDGVVRALPAPARHGDIIHKYPMPEHEHGEQGFIDDRMGFVGRATAARIAVGGGQVNAGKLIAPPDLFSEDLW